ncbi:uncharacterized protein K452DRAFT_51251 [Aplosporella prunicola CBS 121167]|uniref:Uncharacterized protein n=1 Tax=Aplosporella prunicola CBS 121167 TaxID=1176127 RepID=A0A6A6B9T7_9PEZI|nr:uncharacterized protein K452DRAFT_51251 [Aplosporella prunicola CBS 121167]KAF2140796.1 hypothetical protein K452DRAFT_51251 [Aplosporella prunicola CBS 121167]
MSFSCDASAAWLWLDRRRRRMKEGEGSRNGGGLKRRPVVVVVMVVVVREEERNGGGVAEASLPPAITTSHCPGAAPSPGAESRAQKRKGTSGRGGRTRAAGGPGGRGRLVVALAGPRVGPPVPVLIELNGAPGRPTRRASLSPLDLHANSHYSIFFLTTTTTLTVACAHRPMPSPYHRAPVPDMRSACIFCAGGHWPCCAHRCPAPADQTPGVWPYEGTALHD